MSNDVKSKGLDVLPHRDPFLFLDHLVMYSNDGSVGQVTFGAERDFFRGHFPGYPIVPGVILLEAMCQSAAAGVLAYRCTLTGTSVRKVLLFAGADNVRFRRPIRPGETFETHATVQLLKHGVGKFHVRGFVSGILSAEADLTCVEQEESTTC